MKDFPKQLVICPRWSGVDAGGLNVVDPPNMIGPYQLSDALDWYPYRGGWRRRGGTSLFTSDSAGAYTITGIYIFNQADGTKRIVAGHTGGILEDITAGAWGANIQASLNTTSDAYMKFVSALDTLIWVNGHDDVYKATYDAEIVTNGGFGTDASWTKGAGWTIGSGVASKAAGAANILSQDCSEASGSVYTVTYTINSITGGSLTVAIGGVSGTARSAAGTYIESITATGTGNLTFTPSAAGVVCEIDNVSVSEWTPAKLGGIDTKYHPREIKWHKGRLWVTGYSDNRNGALYSQAGTIETWTGDDSGEETFYTPNDASGMVGIGVLRDYLVFLKRHSVGILWGENDPEVWSIRPLRTANGAVAARTIVGTDDGADGVYWLSDEGPMRITMANEIENLGLNIRSAWDGTVWSWDTILKTSLTKAHGIYFAPREEIWWYLEDGGGTGVDYKLVLATRTGEVTIHTDFGYASYFGYDSSNDPVTLIGNAAGHINEADIGWQDSGVDFDDYIQLGIHDEKAPDKEKVYNSIIPLFYSTSTTATCTVSGNLYNIDFKDTINADSLIIGADSGWRFYREYHGMDTADGFLKGQAIQMKFTSIGNWGTHLYGYKINREVVEN